MDTELMDTEVTLDQQQVAPSSATARPAEEFSGYDNATTIEQLLHASLDGHAKSSDATTNALSLAERFAAIVYLFDMAAEGQSERSSPHHRAAGGLSGAESVRSTRGRRIPTRPWRLPAVNRNPKN